MHLCTCKLYIKNTHLPANTIRYDCTNFQTLIPTRTTSFAKHVICLLKNWNIYTTPGTLHLWSENHPNSTSYLNILQKLHNYSKHIYHSHNTRPYICSFHLGYPICPVDHINRHNDRALNQVLNLELLNHLINCYTAELIVATNIPFIHMSKWV